MLEPACRDEIARRVRIPQVIVAALVAGLLTFLAIVLVLIQQGFAGAPEVATILTGVAVAMAVAAVLARLTVPPMIVARARRRIAQGTWQVPQAAQAQSAYSQASQEDAARFLEQTGDAGRLFFVLVSKTIVAAAIVEGAAFFALIAYMLGRSPLALALAILMIAAVAAHFPTRSGVMSWIEGQLRLVEQERQFGR
jgi:hypothetical protein